MKYLIYSLLAITLSSPALAINWDAINQSKVQAYHQLVADRMREERLKEAENHSKPVEMIHDSYRMEACIKRVDQYAKRHGPDLGTLNVKIIQCSKEARITIEQWEIDMAEKYQ